MSKFQLIPKVSGSTLSTELSTKLNNLSQKDRRALVLLAVVLCCTALFGIYKLHSYAGTVEKNARQAQNQLFWLRAQAPLVAQRTKVNTGDLSTIINQAARKQNVSTNLSQNGERAQLSAQNNEASVLGNFFTELSNQGLVFESLTMTQQSDQSILAEATVVKSL